MQWFKTWYNSALNHHGKPINHDLRTMVKQTRRLDRDVLRHLEIHGVCNNTTEYLKQKTIISLTPMDQAAGEKAGFLMTRLIFFRDKFFALKKRYFIIIFLIAIIFVFVFLAENILIIMFGTFRCRQGLTAIVLQIMIPVTKR